MQLSWRVGGDLLDQIGISNQRARSPVLWMWYGEKIKGKPTHSFWTLFPKLFLSLKKKKKCLCSKFGALAPATYLLLSHQKKKKPQKNRGAQLMMWSCWSCQMWCNPKTSAMIKDSACCTKDNVLRWESPLLLEFWNEPLGRDCLFNFFTLWVTSSHDETKVLHNLYKAEFMEGNILHWCMGPHGIFYS